MAILKQDVWALRCAQILIDRYAYEMIDVRTNSKEVWLGNPNRSDFPLLRLSGENFFQRSIDQQRIERIKNAIETFFKREMNLTQVEFFADTPLQNDSDIIYVSPQLCSDVRFCESFPEVQPALMSEEDPQSEYERLLEAFKAMRDKQVRQTRKKFSEGLPWASFTIMGICVAITVAINLFAIKYDIFAASILFGAYYKTFVMAGFEYWRFLTAGFVHIDIFHLFINMMALSNVGMVLERLYGRKKFLSILLLGIVIGCVFVYIGEGNVLTVGISGGLYALLGSLIIYAYDNGWLKNPPFRNQLFFMLGINLLINFLPNISVLGHAGGFVTGVLLGIIYSETPHLAALRKNAKIASIALLVLLIPLSQMNIKTDPLYGKTDQYVLDMARDLNLNGYADWMSERLSNYYEEVSR